jgi:hypothetical protein
LRPEGRARHCGTTWGYGIRAKIMSIHGRQQAPSSQRSHLAVMLLPSGLTVSVDRTAPLVPGMPGCSLAR